MPVATLIIYYLNPTVGCFNLSAPDSVKIHLENRFRDFCGGRITWKGTMDMSYLSQRVDQYIFLSWIEECFGKIQTVSCVPDPTTGRIQAYYIFRKSDVVGTSPTTTEAATATTGRAQGAW